MARIGGKRGQTLAFAAIIIARGGAPRGFVTPGFFPFPSPFARPEVMRFYSTDVFFMLQRSAQKARFNRIIQKQIFYIQLLN
jgi:hypothetical protein